MNPMLSLTTAVLATTLTAVAGLSPVSLRCERRVNPLGVDVPQPLLSWRLEAGGRQSADRGQVQTAYEIQVATSAEKLARGDADLWPSGRITGDATRDILYAGKPLASGQPCVWRVRVWDRDGVASPWSDTATWSMGLLAAADWKAQWIGFDAARRRPVSNIGWGDSVWIWHAADGAQPPEGVRQFRSSFTVPDGAKIKSAEVHVAVDNEAKILVNGTDVLHCGGWQAAIQKDVAKAVKAGANEIQVEGKNSGPDPAGLLLRVFVTLADGNVIESGSTAGWESSKDGKEWAAVRVVGPPGCKPWGETKMAGPVFTPPAALLRKTFAADKPVRRAMLYASALGIADVHLNGRRVAEEWFTPGWTHYPNRVPCRAYDVTKQIRRGENALGIVLGDGWFSGYVGYGHKRDHYGKKTRALAQLHLTYADGSETVVTSGPDWKASTGPVIQQDFLMGETYDARLEQAGWDTPKFDASKWNAVNAGCDEIRPNMQWHSGPPVIAYTEVKPVGITEPKTGTYVFNLGQNFAGVQRLKVRGEAGQKITLRFAERLNPDGTVYTENYRSARSTDTYICKGGGTEEWVPRFTFHGFQYVQVEGLTRKPSPDLVTGLPLGSDTPSAGEFACSDSMLNKLASNTWWTQRSNFIDIPTDCPQRDERLGWTGDAQMYIRAASLHADVQSFFQKWLYDLQDAQVADGQYACVAPPLVATGGGGPAWADAGSVCPWTLYDVYGDRRALERMYPGMKRLVDSYRNRCSPDLKPPPKFHCFGDWLSINADTPKDVIFSAYFALTAKLTAEAAGVLGRAEEEAQYHRLFDGIKLAFNRDYVDDTGRVKGGTQTAYVLAIQFGLVDGARRDAAARHLIADIAQHDGHLTTGFVGTKDLMLVLTKIGRTDVAYRLLHNDTFPSWGFSIKNGATTIWERWNGWTPDKGFGDAGMNSFAHYAFGAVYQWMVENIGGIRNTSPGYRTIVIAPVPDDRLTWARVGYESVNGRIESSWKKEDGSFHLDAVIPPNTTAEIRIPAAEAGAVQEGGRPASSSAGLKFLRFENGAAFFAAGSGRYAFDARL